MRILLAVAFLLPSFSVALSADEVIDRVLAVVAGDLITLSDVNAARDLGLAAPGASGDPVRAVLSLLIDRALILAEVERYAPPEPAADAIDRQVQTVRARFPSQGAFDAVLARSGIDGQSLRETVRQNLRIRAYLEQRFTVPPPSDEELGRYYREHQAAFTRGGTVLPFADVRSEVVQAATDARRATLINAWVTGLHRRAEIIDLYTAAR